MPEKEISTPPRVMVVDDEELIRVVIHDLLTHEGIEVVTASGGDACLQLLRRGFRGVILMDIMMPEKSGWDTIREITAEGLLEGNVITMLTAMDAPDERMEGLQEVVIDYIVKPFDSEDLVAAVRRYFSYVDHPSCES